MIPVTRRVLQTNQSVRYFSQSTAQTLAQQKIKLPQIRDQQLLNAAITYDIDGKQKERQQNKLNFGRLAFLGDSLVDYNVCRHLFTKYPSFSAGELSNLRALLVNRRQLARFAHDTGLDTLITCNRVTEKDNPNVLGEALEAYIGALYLDYGEEAVYEGDWVDQQFFFTYYLFNRMYSFTQTAVTTDTRPVLVTLSNTVRSYQEKLSTLLEVTSDRMAKFTQMTQIPIANFRPMSTTVVKEEAVTGQVATPATTTDASKGSGIVEITSTTTSAARPGAKKPSAARPGAKKPSAARPGEAPTHYSPEANSSLSRPTVVPPRRLMQQDLSLRRNLLLHSPIASPTITISQHRHYWCEQRVRSFGY
ncbi:9959_t:CDS:2 [Paraglomus occultum]|uniref:9959_t:CDS:1 n=1 Tax=Paraglomus occultum TaxID=144539 RepID=A0A9N9FHR3_9GLOM|nr:9959_t:CDS:2 [Paraglomus occultum]